MAAGAEVRVEDLPDDVRQPVSQAPAGAVAKLMEDLTENQGLPATLYDDEALMA